MPNLMNNLTTDDRSMVTSPLHFHACLDQHPERPASGQKAWTEEEVAALFELPFSDLIFQAQTVPRRPARISAPSRHPHFRDHRR